MYAFSLIHYSSLVTYRPDLSASQFPPPQHSLVRAKFELEVETMPVTKDETVRSNWSSASRRTPAVSAVGVNGAPIAKKTPREELKCLLKECLWNLGCHVCSFAFHQATNYAIPLFILYVMWLIIMRLLIV